METGVMLLQPETALSGALGEGGPAQPSSRTSGLQDVRADVPGRLVSVAPAACVPGTWSVLDDIRVTDSEY